jgi:hypothetical protein
VSDPEGYAANLVKYANVIYENSDVPVRLIVRCVTEWVGFTETENSSAMLRKFITAGGEIIL